MIDGGIFLGRNPINGNSFEESQIINQTGKFPFQKAIVSSFRSIFYDYKEGNEEVLNLYRKYPDRVIPSAFIQPNGFDSIKDQQYLKNLSQSGFKVFGVYLNPKYYEIQLESLHLRNIIRSASKIGFVIQFGLENIRDLFKIAEFYRFISGPVLIRWMCGGGYNNIAEIITYAQKFKNFYFDVGSLTSSGGIRYLVDAIGADRLYLASNVPESFELAPHFLLRNAGLKKKEIEQIYSGTLSDVFKLKQSIKQSYNSVDQIEIFKSITDAPKIDTHWHSEGWNIIEPEKIIDRCESQDFKTFNYKNVIFSSIKALNYDLEEGNRGLFELIKQDKRFYGLIVIDPTRIELSMKQIEKYASSERCAGVKTIQDLYGIGLDHPSYSALLDLAERKKMTVMAHIPGMNLAAEKHPDLKFVCAHSTYKRAKHLFGHRNVYFDIATSQNDRGEMNWERFVQEAGINRILFASDGPLVSPAWTLGKLASVNLSPDQLSRILFENAREAFPRLKAEKAMKKVSETV